MGYRSALNYLLAGALALTGAARIQAGGPPDTQSLPLADPETIGMDPVRLSRIDDAIAAAIRAGEIPGAVVLVARHGRIGYWRAFGTRSIVPKSEPMTPDTIFDMASLTKVLATTPAAMLLVQDGRLRLADRVKRYLPLFAGGGKDEITVRQLLTHYSGLPADFDLSKPWQGREAALLELWSTEVQAKPGKEFLYSDLNFITLGEIIRAIDGRSLDVFAQEEIYRVLGMNATMFQPPPRLWAMIAPTESRARSLQYLKGTAPASAASMLRGEVHDPTAWRMGGVAGHAGLFSSAPDVAVYAQMLLERGRFRGGILLAPQTVDAMTRAQSPPNAPVRGYGWDIDTAYSAPRGDLFAGGFGHTGFTGTSLWIHPPTESFLVLLSNRVHPDGKGDVTRLRAMIANIVAASMMDSDEGPFQDR